MGSWLILLRSALWAPVELWYMKSWVYKDARIEVHGKGSWFPQNKDASASCPCAPGIMTYLKALSDSGKAIPYGSWDGHGIRFLCQTSGPRFSERRG